MSTAGRGGWVKVDPIIERSVKGVVPMRAIVNAILSYGLVNVPVGVCTATREKGLKFTTLHAECGSKVGQRLFCPVCDRLVEQGELSKGFEVTKGRYVKVDPEILTQLKGERAHVIVVESFVRFDQIDELAPAKSYWLDPAAALAGPYSLLAGAMLERKVVGVGRESLFGKESPCMVWAHSSGALALSTLFCADEIVSPLEIVSKMPDPPEDLMGMALQYVDLNTDTEAPVVVSPGRDRVQEYVDAVIRGAEFQPEEAAPAPEATLQGLMESLRASVEATQKQRAAAGA